MVRLVLVAVVLCLLGRGSWCKPSVSFELPQIPVEWLQGLGIADTTSPIDGDSSTPPDGTGGCVAEMFYVAGISKSSARGFERTLVRHSVPMRMINNPTDTFLRLIGVSEESDRLAFLRCFGDIGNEQRPALCSNYTACNGHGTCNLTESRGYVCNCEASYHGRFCDWQTSHCSGQPCLNDGVCESTLNGFKCQCPVGYRGTNCQEKWLTKPFLSNLLSRQKSVENLLTKVIEQNAKILANQQQYMAASSSPELEHEEPATSVYYRLYMERVQWHQAVSKCAEHGGALASIRSQEQQDLVTQIPGLEETDILVWLGATDADHEGQWSWVSGGNLTYERWSNLFPGRSAENCLALMRLNSQYSWDDVACPHTLTYICEFHTT